MPEAQPRVYVSYAWGGESEKVVDEVEAALRGRGIPFVRDKAELGYKGRIREFMQEIGHGHAVGAAPGGAAAGPASPAATGATGAAAPAR